MVDALLRLLLIALPAISYKVGYDDGFWHAQRRQRR